MVNPKKQQKNLYSPANQEETNSDGAANENNDTWPRYLKIVVTDAADNGPVAKLTPFAIIAKGSQGWAGEPKIVKRSSRGSLWKLNPRSTRNSYYDWKV